MLQPGNSNDADSRGDTAPRGTPTPETWWNRPGGMREVLVLALPLIVSTMSWTLMFFIDRVLLLGYSTQSVAAALASGALGFAMICPMLGIASYVNAFVAQYHGAKLDSRIGPVVWQAVGVGFITVPLVLATIPLAPWMFAIAGHESSIAAEEVTYYQINCWGNPAIVIAAALSSFFTGRSEARTVMIVDTLAALTNVVLDYAWIYGYWGFPRAGIAGAAWATVIALWLKVVIYFVLFMRPEYRERFQTWAGCRFDRHQFWRLIRYGTPNGAQLLLEVAGFTAFLMLVGHLGADEVTATSLAFNVNTLAFMPVLGIGIATTTMVGQRMGEGRPDLAARSTWTAFTLAAGLMLVMTVVYVFAPRAVMLAHWSMIEEQESGQLRAITELLLRFVGAYCIFDAMNVVFSSAIKGAGDTRFILFTTLSMSGLPVVMTWVGLTYWDYGLLWSWVVVTAWVMGLGVIYWLRFLQGKWRQMSVIEQVDIDESGGELALEAT